MARRSAVIIFILMLGLSSLAFSARKLTTPQIRRNTIRINALEIEKIDITEIIGDPKQEGPKDVIVVMDERSLLFDFDKSDVKPQYYEMLHKFIEYVNYNNYNVVIEGHTDSKGTNEYNMKLGLRRAENAKRSLLELGMPVDRIKGTASKGEEEPVASNETEAGRAQNRRIEFKLSKRSN